MARAFTRTLAVVAAAGLVVAVVWGGLALWRAIASPDRVEFRVLGVDGPIAGATITAPEETGMTEGEAGAARLVFTPPAVITVSAPGYTTGQFDVQAVPLESPLFLQLEPVVLQGRVLNPNGVGLPSAEVTLHERTVTTGEFGGFEIVAAAPGTISIEKRAWEHTETDWDGSSGRLDITMEPFVVRGLRVDADTVASPGKFAGILDMAEESMVNTLVFDTKEESGAVLYASKVPEATEIGAIRQIYDPGEALAQAKERGLYTITRIVTFQDGYRSVARPEHAVMDNTTGEIWRNQSDLGWMDPTDPASWDYPIALGVEACELGFDEIQFDYVRFPTDGDVTITDYDVPLSPEVRVETIAAFLEAARDEIHAAGCAVSADIFAIVLSVSDDQGLGQRPEDMSWAVDAISPMVYPSHYGPGWLGYESPNAYPAEVVGNALDSGIPKMIGGAILRPWLQSFGYTADQIRVEIGEAEKRSLGWLLWNAFSDFVPGSLPSG